MDQYEAEKQHYRFANVEVDMSRGCLTVGGDERHLRQKAFQVLIYLLAHRERLVLKSDLFDSIWPETAVTEDVLVQCVKEIRRAIGDDTQRPRFIKTVPKYGYRFIGKVEDEVRDAAENDHLTTTGPVSVVNIKVGGMKLSPNLPHRGYRYLTVPVVLMFAVTIAYFVWPFASKTSEARLPVIEGRKTVAVMFFDNRSNSAEFGWLREGLTDMLIAGLSRSEKLTVLSRDQLFSLLGRNIDKSGSISIEKAREIAGKSQAESFIMGSFAQIGNAIRLDVRIFETQTSNLLSTESLTVEKAEQLLSQIDMLSLKLSNRLGADPGDKYNMARVMTDNLAAYRSYSLAVEKAHAYHTLEAIELFERAIELDPEFAMALARIGYTYSVTAGDVEKGKPYLEKAYQLASRLTDKDRLSIAAWYAIANLDYPGAIKAYREINERFPLEVEAYSRLARLLRGENRPDEAIDVLRKGLAIDPEAAEIYNALGNILSGQGKHIEAINSHEHYVALAPAEPNAFDSLGLSYQGAGNYQKAVENYTQALKLNPKFEIAIIHLGNTRFRMGQYTEAIAEFRRYIQTAPSNIEKRRGYDSLTSTYLAKGDLQMAGSYSIEVQKIEKDITLNEYLLAVNREQVEKASMLGNLLLARIDSGDRGARSNQRLAFYYRGLVAQNNGKPDQGIEYFSRVTTHPPPTWHNTDFEDSLARGYLNAGRFDESIAEYQRIVAANPNYPLAYFYLGEAFKGKGMAGDARVSYERFLEVWKDADTDIPEIVYAKKYLGS